MHALVFAPDFPAALRLNKALAAIGSIISDGRPILKLDVKTLLEMVLEASPDAMLVPAHVWTPHFSVLGATSAFNSLEECFEELTPHIYALETGLSSNPAMNWRLSQLDAIRLISISDAHIVFKSWQRGNIFDTDNQLWRIMGAIKAATAYAAPLNTCRKKANITATATVAATFALHRRKPSPTAFAAACGKKVTLEVLHRVEELADRPEGFKPADAAPFYSAIPLQELIAETLQIGAGSKRVERMYFSMLENLGNELGILLEKDLPDIAGAAAAQIAEAIGRVREGYPASSPVMTENSARYGYYESITLTVGRSFWCRHQQPVGH